jgi:hypothetical protein
MDSEDEFLTGDSTHIYLKSDHVAAMLTVDAIPTIHISAAAMAPLTLNLPVNRSHLRGLVGRSAIFNSVS